jgi:hypothetical protein
MADFFYGSGDIGAPGCPDGIRDAGCIGLADKWQQLCSKGVVFDTVDFGPDFACK